MMNHVARAGLLGLVLVAFSPGVARADDWSTWPDPGKAARATAFTQTLGHHFTLGVGAPQAWFDETASSNAATWDIRTAYLSGSPARPDATPPVDPPYWIKYSDYPTVMSAECQSGTHASTPWFTYYALAQSYPGNYGDGTTVSGGPAMSTPYNAKRTDTMRAYFEQFKYLMQHLANRSPQTIVVHIEPDEWGHLLLSGVYTWPTLDPTTVDVKVGSTGMPELAGFPDNMYGFAGAFKKLRDTYAPAGNVLLLTNPSGWDGEPGHSMSGTNFGTIMKELCGDWEGAVFETGDRDKGLGDSTIVPPYVDSSGVPSISITGNVDKHIQWITDFHAASSLPVFIWQAAIGNTYFKTCNNTDGHYMDNLAQTLLDDYPSNDTVSRYATAGCMGWVFSGGQGASTNVYDAHMDGITNPDTVPGNLGNTSIYADDDGGYMRLRGQAYYAQPYLFDGPAGNAGAGGESGASGATAGTSSEGGSSPGGTAGSSAGHGGGGAAEAGNAGNGGDSGSSGTSDQAGTTGQSATAGSAGTSSGATNATPTSGDDGGCSMGTTGGTPAYGWILVASALVLTRRRGREETAPG